MIVCATYLAISYYRNSSFKHLPQQCRLPAEAKQKVASLLQMKANKKLIQQEVSKDTGKIILLNDIYNIATAFKQCKTQNNLDMTVQMLTDKYGTALLDALHYVCFVTCRCRC